jgi:hypothetical protein
MVSMAINRWVCRPRILSSVAVLSLAYYAVFMGGVPRQWKERFGREGEAIDESLKAVLNETLGVNCWFSLLFWMLEMRGLGELSRSSQAAKTVGKGE